MIKPKKLLRPHPSPKNSPIGPQKPQMTPKAKNQKFWKQKILQNKSYQSQWLNPKKLLRPHPAPKKVWSDRAPKASKWPQKQKSSCTRKLQSNIYQFTLVTPKKLLNTPPLPWKSWPKRLKMTPKSKVRKWKILHTKWKVSAIRKASNWPLNEVTLISHKFTSIILNSIWLWH